MKGEGRKEIGESRFTLRPSVKEIILLKHYLTIAWRNLLKYKIHSVINIIGPAVGIACIILILAFVQHEWTINKNFAHAEQIFRVGTIWKQEPSITTPPTIAPILSADYPEVVAVNRYWGGFVIINVGENSFRDDMWITDSTFFNVFDFRFIQGNPHHALSKPNSLVLTEQLAQKYFGRIEVLGETLKLRTYNTKGTRDYQITGVLENPPENSITGVCGGDMGKLFVPFANFNDFFDENRLASWKDFPVLTFIQLKDAARATALQQKLPQLLDKYCPTEVRADLELKLDPLTDLYLTDNNSAVAKLINGLLFLIFLIILAASINFMNLSTARSSLRAKEIGVRKVLGSVRKQLLWQFMSEAILLSFIALLVGIMLAELCLGQFQALFGKEFALDYNRSLSTMISVIGLALLVGIISGSYPALFLSSFNPVLALKGGLKSGKSHLYMRRFLVITQFVLAIGFAIAAHITAKQLQFITKQDLGFNHANVLVIRSVPREWNFAGVQKLEVVKRELMSLPEVSAASISWDLPSEHWRAGSSLWSTDAHEDQAIKVTNYTVDESYPDVYDLQLVEGRFFSKNFFYADTSKSVVLNQAAVKALEWESAVGKNIKIDGFLLNVVGVIKDFNFEPLSASIKPLALFYVYGWCHYRYISIKFHSPDVAMAIANIEKTWKGIYPDAPFEYSLMADDIQINYKQVMRQIKITGIASLLAISIACLGLLGLISFTAERRTKEIGVRKVLGASVANIISLLSQEFFKLVLLANVIAWPLAYFFMNQWLQDWAYRIEFDVWLFLLPGALALLIALLTVSTQAIKDALANPVEALRYE